MQTNIKKKRLEIQNRIKPLLFKLNLETSGIALVGNANKNHRHHDSHQTK